MALNGVPYFHSSTVWYLALTFFFSGSAIANTLTIPSGANTPTIVKPANAGVPLNFAASELQKYIKKITGTLLPIVADTQQIIGPKILLTGADSPNSQNGGLGRGFAHPPAGTDAFILRTAGEMLVIAGGRDRAVLYGVYDLLERLGCRWLGPGEEVVPVRTPLKIPSLHVAQKPDLKHRVLELISGSRADFVDWMAKVKLNGAWPETYIPNSDLTENQTAKLAQAVPEMIERGMTIFYGGHILPILFPEDSAHPEYFAWYTGRGRLNPDVDQQSRLQICTSYDPAMKAVTDNVVRFLNHHSWIQILVLWGNDVYAWCECDGSQPTGNCMALLTDPNRPTPFGPDRSELYCRMVKIVNEGLPGQFEGVKTRCPGQALMFNHYYNLENLPDNRSFLPDRSVISAVDAFRQCDRHPFTDPTCPAGKRVEPIANMWKPYYPKSVSWSYYWSMNFMGGLPISMVHKIPDDFRFVRSLGIDGVVDNVSMSPVGGLPWYYNRLNFYIYAKAAWNPDLHVDTTVDDFIEHYYGPAAKPMKDYWRFTEEVTVKFNRDPKFMTDFETSSGRNLSDPGVIHGWMRDLKVKAIVPNRWVFDTLIGHLRKAKSLAAGDRTALFRVGLLETKIAQWDPAYYDFDAFGYFNGGGLQFTVNGKEINCTVAGGQNIGDCYWPKPAGTGQLVEVGDTFIVHARINYGEDIVGEPLYRSGPGIYLSEDQTGQAGSSGHHSAMFMLTEDADQRVISVVYNNGGYQSGSNQSPENLWKFGENVALKIAYSDRSSGHTYTFSYNVGAGFVPLGSQTYPRKLAFAASMHKWGGLHNGRKTKFPVINWATVRMP